jgi:hypothetical protein
MNAKCLCVHPARIDVILFGGTTPAVAADDFTYS